MTQETLHQRLEEIFTLVPEVADMDLDLNPSDTPMDCAMELQDAFPIEKMPDVVADFLLEVYEEEYSNGSPDAANNLGALYHGWGDYAKALELYLFAAEFGDQIAYENLGFFYLDEEDYEKAFQYFSMGAFIGRGTSLFMIGDMFRYGWHVEKNEEQAYLIYMHCLDCIDEECGADVVMRLGDCYADGIGTERDYEKAMILYQDAANQFMARREMDEDYQHCVRREKEMRNILEQRT